jgi:hypothetical protein
MRGGVYISVHRHLASEHVGGLDRKLEDKVSLIY